MDKKELKEMTLEQLKNIKVKDIKSTPVADTTDVKH